LIASLALNLAALAYAVRKVRRIGPRYVVDRLLRRPAARPDFGGLARSKFVRPSSGAVVLLGDSQLEWAPVTDLLDLSVRNRALSGARTSDLAAWLDLVLAERPAHVVLMIGSNDAWFGRPPAESEAALRRVLARVRDEVGCPVTVVSVPPLVGRAREVAAVNRVLSTLAAEFDHRFVDITSTLAALPWTEDGLHLNGRAYEVVAPLVRAAAGI
jgi:lysophospholipase L1-like esterase